MTTAAPTIPADTASTMVTMADTGAAIMGVVVSRAAAAVATADGGDSNYRLSGSAGEQKVRVILRGQLISRQTTGAGMKVKMIRITCRGRY
jgi:hypothetical protein